MCDNFQLVSPHSQLGAAYVSATTGAVVTALGLKSLATVIPRSVAHISDVLVHICLNTSLIVSHICSVSLQSSAGLSPLLLLLLLTVSTYPS